MRRRRRRPPAEPGPPLDEIVETARRDGALVLGSLTVAEARTHGMSGPESPGTEAASSHGGATIPGPGDRDELLRSVRNLFMEHSRAVAGWELGPIDAGPDTPTPMWRLAVLDIDPPDLVLVQKPGDVPIGGGAGELTLELVRPDQLAERLATLAFRAPHDEFERAAFPGLQAVFTGPDRRAKDVPTRLIHEWDARRAKMVRWAYTLAGKADSGDWVSRRPQVIHGVTPQRYRDHLLWRFKKRTPGL